MKLNFLKKNIFYKDYDSKFLTPKRIISLIISGLVFGGFVVLSFVLLDINIPDIFSHLSMNIQAQPFLVAFLLITILCPFFKASFTIFYIRPAMKNAGINVSWLEYIILAFKVFFFNTITPFASGGEPYVIYWIKSRGGTLKLAGSLSLVSMIVGSVGQILLTIPSFIIISMDYNNIIAINSNGLTGALIYWFIVGGLLLNIVILALWIAIGISKKFHYGCSKFSNWILMKIKRPYLTKEEMYNKYIVEAEFQEMFYREMRKWKKNLWVALYIVTTDILLYLSVFFSFALISPNFEVNNETFWNMFNITNVSLTANNFIPIPSGEGTIQLTIGTLSKVYFANDLGGIYNSIGFWKIMTNYLPLFFSVLVMGWYYFFKIILIQKFSKKPKEGKIIIENILNEPLEAKVNLIKKTKTTSTNQAKKTKPKSTAKIKKE